MKRLNLIMLLFLFTICSRVYATPDDIIPPVSPPPSPPHILLFFQPITIHIYENSLAIHFNKTIGETEIAIMNEMGETVYNGSTNTDISPDFFIPTVGLESGIYTISFQYGDSILTQSFAL